MYSTLIYWHSILRWIVLIALVFAIGLSVKGYFKKTEFSKFDNAFRHWTATISHVQLMLGILLFTQSLLVKYAFKNFKQISFHSEAFFFGIIHILFMLSAIVCITIGSAKAKRKALSKDQYNTMLIWFSIALLLILIAIPWPFSPFAQRPYLR